jgi:hypothetical protein
LRSGITLNIEGNQGKVGRIGEKRRTKKERRVKEGGGRS